MAKEILTYVVIDNAPASVEAVQELAAKIAWLQEQASFTDPFEGMSYLNQHEVDLLFLDIDMPGLMGTELLRMLEDPPVTIFCTGHQEFALDGYELDVADFLLKPFSFDRFYNAVQRARKQIRSPFVSEELQEIRDEIIALRLDRGLHTMINISHINYVLANNDESTISVDPTCQTGEWANDEHQEKLIRTRMRFKELADLLRPQRFIEIRRGCIVALDRILYIKTEGFVVLTMPPGKRLSITERKKRVLLKWFGSGS